jgi:Kef-type K+ transport system membrane component KefB
MPHISRAVELLALATTAAAAPPRPLDGHAVLLLLLELSVLVGLARILSEVAKRLDQPAVIGELLAGILLGPSVFGALAPDAFAWLFPPSAAQLHLLEAISWIGMLLLLLLTGLEIDVRALREIGGPTLTTASVDMIVSAGCGFALGMALPDSLLARPDQRGIFAAFLGTAVAISAMPVIAKILLDLDLLKRNVGMVTLSAGVIDDTVGWIALSVISAMAAFGSFQPARLAQVLALTALFLVACRYVLFPAIRRGLKFIDDRKELQGTDLAAIFVITLALAAATELIGIHAAFGALVAGIVLRQAPRLRWRSVHNLDTVVQAIFSPIFFAFVGVKVDLGAVESVGLVAAAVGVSVASKLVGCTAGGLLGGLGLWESFSVGCGMSARGAMGLVVALVGLSLGILNAESYTLIVIMAVATSVLAPPMLRWAVRRVPLSESEQLRVSDDIARPHFRKERIKVMVPMAGGPNAMRALAIAAPLARREGSTLTVLSVVSPAGGAAEPPRSLRDRLFGPRRARAASSESVFAQAAPTAAAWKVTLDRRAVQSESPVDAIVKETGRNYDLLVLGASGDHRSLHSRALEDIIRRSPCHVAIFKNKDREEKASYRDILVPSEGSYFANVALELAAAYAEEVGARVTLLHVLESHATRPDVVDEEAVHDAATVELLRTTLRASIAPILKRFKVEVDVRITEGDHANSTIVREVAEGPYDLLVIGAENRAVVEGLFLGRGTEYVVDEATCSVLVVIPEGISGPSARPGAPKGAGR